MNSRHPPTELEILTHPPQDRTSRTPLLFVHGAYTSAWCWEDRYLPFFAQAGFEAHAVSLSGHGRSRPRKSLDTLSIADYVSDVREAVATMAEPPVLIGHSMGSFVVQKYLEQYRTSAAVLMCPIPPQGMIGAVMTMMWSRPQLLVELNRAMNGSRHSLNSLRDVMFSHPLSVEATQRLIRHLQRESYRALWDMMIPNVPRIAQIKRTPLLVLGSAHDQLIPQTSAEMTARTYGIEAEIFADMGHVVMLERDWHRPAQRILLWLGELGLVEDKGEPQ